MIIKKAVSKEAAFLIPCIFTCTVIGNICTQMNQINTFVKYRLFILYDSSNLVISL